MEKFVDGARLVVAFILLVAAFALGGAEAAEPDAAAHGRARVQQRQPAPNLRVEQYKAEKPEPLEFRINEGASETSNPVVTLSWRVKNPKGGRAQEYRVSSFLNFAGAEWRGVTDRGPVYSFGYRLPQDTEGPTTLRLQLRNDETGTGLVATTSITYLPVGRITDFTVDLGAQETNEREVKLTWNVDGVATHYRVSERSDFTFNVLHDPSPWRQPADPPLTPGVPWILDAEDFYTARWGHQSTARPGPKTFYLRLKRGDGLSEIATATINYLGLIDRELNPSMVVTHAEERGYESRASHVTPGHCEVSGSMFKVRPLVAGTGAGCEFEILMHGTPKGKLKQGWTLRNLKVGLEPGSKSGAGCFFVHPPQLGSDQISAIIRVENPGVFGDASEVRCEIIELVLNGPLDLDWQTAFD